MTTLNEAWQAWVPRLTQVGKPVPTYWEAFKAGWDAVIEATGGTDHIVEVTGRTWTLQHPITDRLEGQLFSCPFNDLVSVAAEQGAFGKGLHRVWVDRNVLQWEEVG